MEHLGDRMLFNDVVSRLLKNRRFSVAVGKWFRHLPGNSSCGSEMIINVFNGINWIINWYHTWCRRNHHLKPVPCHGAPWEDGPQDATSVPCVHDFFGWVIRMTHRNVQFVQLFFFLFSIIWNYTYTYRQICSMYSVCFMWFEDHHSHGKPVVRAPGEVCWFIKPK